LVQDNPTAAKFDDTGVEVASHSIRESLTFRNAGIYYALMLIVAIFTWWSYSGSGIFYLNASNVENVLEQAATPVAIIAIGMTVLMVSGNFDLSVTSNAALSAMSIAIAIEHGWFSFLGGPEAAVVASLIFGVIVGTVAGLINGLIHWYVGLNSFIVTLGSLTAYRGLTLLIANDASVDVRFRKELTEEQIANNDRETEEGQFLGELIGDTIGDFNLLLLAGLGFLVAAGGMFISGQAKVPVRIAAGIGLFSILTSFFVDYTTSISHKLVVLVILLIVTWAFMTFTAPGLHVYAVGGNLEASKAAGINVALYRIVPFMFVGFCCGLAAVTYIAEQKNIEPNLWFGRELWVLASCIIGGVSLTGGSGKVMKSMAGALLLYTLLNGFQINRVAPSIQDTSIGVLIVASAAAYALAERRAAAKGQI
jgi:D-xylose transport system permease protein